MYIPQSFFANSQTIVFLSGQYIEFRKKLCIDFVLYLVIFIIIQENLVVSSQVYFGVISHEKRLLYFFGSQIWRVASFG